MTRGSERTADARDDDVGRVAEQQQQEDGHDARHPPRARAGASLRGQGPPRASRRHGSEGRVCFRRGVSLRLRGSKRAGRRASGWWCRCEFTCRCRAMPLSDSSKTWSREGMAALAQLPCGRHHGTSSGDALAALSISPIRVQKGGKEWLSAPLGAIFFSVPIPSINRIQTSQTGPAPSGPPIRRGLYKRLYNQTVSYPAAISKDAQI